MAIAPYQQVLEERKKSKVKNKSTGTMTGLMVDSIFWVFDSGKNVMVYREKKAVGVDDVLVDGTETLPNQRSIREWVASYAAAPGQRLAKPRLLNAALSVEITHHRSPESTETTVSNDAGTLSTNAVWSFIQSINKPMS